MPAESGQARRITRNGVSEGFESTDGKPFHDSKGRDARVNDIMLLENFR